MPEERWLPVDVIALGDAIDLDQYKQLTGFPWPHPVSKDADSQIKQLVQEFKATMWTELPLLAIAEAYRKRAEDLIAQGTDSGNARAVYIEYAKYLALHPEKKSEDYRKIFIRVKALEQAIVDNTTLPERLHSLLETQSAPTHSASTTWAFLLLGLLTVSALPVFLRRT
ncbi:hypothetical protein C8F04DRAFT_1095196 [Mycena alexandri]|uniref:Uncharacterized protein n=1 Tax=Mycena alexandri TaxID=1745969 RepID=A0AAD6SYW5_9AGAR|nr:hypothetical protein C8F04DRAFT_1095196 [Mycena alexandri]